MNVLEVKQRLRSLMNGPVSASMRAKGLTYRLNYGVELPRLLELAHELPHDFDLAADLWKEDCRECRILAGLLMPVGEDVEADGAEAKRFTSDFAEVWIEQMRFVEEAEMTAMNALVRLSDASVKAFEWIAREEEMYQLCGYLTLTRLLSRGAALTVRDHDELTDQARSAVASEACPASVRAAAARLLSRLAE